MSWISWGTVETVPGEGFRASSWEGSHWWQPCLWLEKALAAAVGPAQARPFWESHLPLQKLATGSTDPLCWALRALAGWDLHFAPTLQAWGCHFVSAGPTDLPQVPLRGVSVSWLGSLDVTSGPLRSPIAAPVLAWRLGASASRGGPAPCSSQAPVHSWGEGGSLLHQNSVGRWLGCLSDPAESQPALRGLGEALHWRPVGGGQALL